MAFCPFYSLECPETAEGVGGCKVWVHGMCCMVDKPGVYATYTDGDPVMVYIMGIFSSNAKASGDILIIYCNAETGVIGTSDDLSKFVVGI